MINKLSVKLAILLILTGPIFIFMGVIIPTIIKRALVNLHIITFTNSTYIIFVLAALLIALSFPVLSMSMLLSWYVLRPFKRIQTAIKSLKDNHYKTVIPLIHIQEFDVLINEINVLSQKLQEEEDMRKDLISNTSHELNTPLTSISTQLQGMIDGVIPITKETLIALHYQSERINNLVEQLQKYASIRSKLLRIHKEVIPLKSLVQEIIDMFQQKAKEYHIEIQNSIANSTTLYSDPDLLRQILINIINNGIIHSSGTRISISFIGNIISISDNGIGISEDKKILVFEKFYKARDSTGLGLGLAITKELVESLGWEITLRNNTPEPGITCEIKCSEI